MGSVIWVLRLSLATLAECARANRAPPRPVNHGSSRALCSAWGSARCALYFHGSQGLHDTTTTISPRSEAMKSILAVVGDGAARPLLETALLVAKRFNGRIVGLNTLTTEYAVVFGGEMGFSISSEVD